MHIKLFVIIQVFPENLCAQAIVYAIEFLASKTHLRLSDLSDILQYFQQHFRNPGREGLFHLIFDFKASSLRLFE